jgi:hypothetical protein
VKEKEQFVEDKLNEKNPEKMWLSFISRDGKT